MMHAYLGRRTIADDQLLAGLKLQGSEGLSYAPGSLPAAGHQPPKFSLALEQY